MRVVISSLVLLSLIAGYCIGYTQFYQKPIEAKRVPMELPYLIINMEVARDSHARIIEDPNYRELLEEHYQYVTDDEDQREWIRVYDKVIKVLKDYR